MSVALPDGFTDCGEARTVANSGSVKLRLDSNPGFYVGFAGLSTPFILRDTSILGSCVLIPDPGVPVGAGYWECTLEGPAPGILTPVVMEHTAFGCRVGPWSRYSNVYSYVETSGPYRLGVRLEPINTPTSPEFWDNWKQRYEWFADEDTQYEASMAGYSTGTLHFQPGGGSAPWGAGTHPGMTPEIFPLSPLQWIFGTDGGTPNAGDETSIQAVFTALQADGTTVDTDDLNTDMMKGGGSGIVNCYQPPHPFNDQDEEGASPPHRFTYDLDISKFGDGSTNARIVDSFVVPHQDISPGVPRLPQADYLALPYTNTFLVHNVSWATTKKIVMSPFYFDLQSAWALAQSPSIPLDDWQVPIYASPALFDPGSVAPYRPVAVTVGAVSVHRPNGLRPSDWVTSDGAKLTVTEGTNTLFHCISTGATATRAFLTHWRNWTTPGDPAYGLDYYEITRHDYFSTGSDVFGWQHFGWLLINITAPSAGSLTLTVSGVQLSVEDPHDGTDATLTETAFTKTYSVSLASGANSVYIDLLYPNEGGPFYFGRVDSIQLSGFAVGDYTLSGLTLIPREAGYLKCDFGAPVQRGDYDATVWAQDGAFTLGNWPDQANKTEIGQDGGGVRYVFIFTDSEGNIADFVLSLMGFWKKLDRLEGFVATYDASIYNAANQDTFGNSLGPETAEWTWSIVPFVRVTPGTPYHPDCSPRVRRLQIVNGQPFHVLVRWVLWAAIEDMVTQGGQRAPAGVAATATRVDTGAIFTALTDPSGYAVIHPVPGEVDYDVH